MVFLMYIIYSFSSLRWFTTYRFCPKQLLMLLRVTPLIQSILQKQEYDFNMLVDHSGARYTTCVSAVNRKLSAIKHALRAKNVEIHRIVFCRRFNRCPNKHYQSFVFKLTILGNKLCTLQTSTLTKNVILRITHD